MSWVVQSSRTAVARLLWLGNLPTYCTVSEKHLKWCLCADFWKSCYIVFVNMKLLNLLNFSLRNNYRFKGSFKNSTEEQCTHQFSPNSHNNLNNTIEQGQNQETDISTIHRPYSDFTSFTLIYMPVVCVWLHSGLLSVYSCLYDHNKDTEHRDFPPAAEFINVWMLPDFNKVGYYWNNISSIDCIVFIGPRLNHLL